MFLFPEPKVFCIGRNKTGTTSLAVALRTLGYKLASTRNSEAYLVDWSVRKFDRLIRYCRRYGAFEDIPFSLDFTYVALDQAFPGAKFVLTERDSGDVWYDSCIRFRKKVLGIDHLPTVEDMKAFNYRGDPKRKGELWERTCLMVPEGEVFQDREAQIRRYERHNKLVKEYFARRPESLLVLNLAESDSMERLCAFLGKPYHGQPMPHENRSD